LHASKGYPPLKEIFLPLVSSSDAFVVSYRRWLDAVRDGLPWAVGWNTVKMPKSLILNDNLFMSMILLSIIDYIAVMNKVFVKIYTV
jgi:hypothetical protein